MRVLIVDDCDELRVVLRVLLERQAGIDVLEAACAEDALDLAGREGVDLVVMDHSMPGMSGVDCLRALRARDPATECVAFTSMPDCAASFLAAGAARHFTKPEVDPLIDFVRERSADGRGSYRVPE